MGERKSEIFDILPDQFIPATQLIEKGNESKALLEAATIGYPIIAKPDIGERGTWVQKIDSEDELMEYVRLCPVDFLLQELVNYPIELGVFYVRRPGEENGKVTSIVRKDFLKVRGDGSSTINDLLTKSDRAQLTADLNSSFLQENGSVVPSEGEEILIEPIGNHCRGTQFLDDEEQINGSLHAAFDSLAKAIPDFYFGRFDIKCKSYKELSQLSGFKILELNGAGAEPGHIYQPGYSLIKAYKAIFWHLGVLADISAENKKRGTAYWTFRQGYRKWRSHQEYNKLLSF